MIETVPPGTLVKERYRIERVLGSGGFGHVYLARDQQLHRLVAVKEYLVSGPSGYEQLTHEATVLSQLHHPSLPAFLDAFHEQGHYYVVLNYIEGNDLTDIIRQLQKRNEVLSLSQILTWTQAIGDAVLFLHRQQPPVIHRDIKPDNIRITSDGTAILVDLGNAKAAADGARTLFFIRHQGTPGYAPPEQYPGGTGTDTRSDIYALGSTLFFALTAQEPPSVSARNQAIQQRQPDLPSLQDILAQNPSENTAETNPAKQFRLGVSKPTKPSPRHSRHLAQLGTLNPTVLKQLNFILQKSMAMHPNGRYQSIADFTHALEQVSLLISNAANKAAPSYNTQPIGPSQTAYKTQPNLSMMYDILEQAKASNNAPVQEQIVNVSSSQQEQQSFDASLPSIPSISQERCTQCGGLHKAGASFCPHCGTQIQMNHTATNAAVTHSANTTQTAQPTPFTASGLQFQQQMLHPSSTTNPKIAKQAVDNDVSTWNTDSNIAHSTKTGSPLHRKQVMQSSPSSTSRVNIGLLLAVALFVILIVLIVILVILLVHHTQQGIITPSLTHAVAQHHLRPHGDKRLSYPLYPGW